MTTTILNIVSLDAHTTLNTYTPMNINIRAVNDRGIKVDDENDASTPSYGFQYAPPGNPKTFCL